MAWYDVLWERRVKIDVQDTDIDSNLTDFPIYHRLDDHGATFWDNVRSDGGDIRITTSDGSTEVPVEVVSIDTVGETGHIYFKGDPTATGATTFYMYFDCPSAGMYGIDETYGRENVWKSAFGGVWHLDGTPTNSAGDTIDSTSNANHGQTNGSMSGSNSVAAKAGKGYEFEGINDYVAVPHDTSLDSTTDISVSLWFNEQSSSGWTNIIAKRDGSNYNYLMNFNKAGGTDAFQWGFNDGTGNIQAETWSTNFSNNTWYHVVATLSQNGANVDSEIFVNGASIGTTTHTSKTLTAYSVPLHFAATDTTFLPDELLDGKLDEVRFATEVHSDAWIKAQYTAENAPTSFIVISTHESKSSVETSEISTDYVTDNSSLKAEITAQAAKLDGTGEKSAIGWLVAADGLPTNMLDSGHAHGEASGAPTVRFSDDEAGNNQYPCEIVDFTPTAGAVGATAEIWISPGTYTGGTDKSMWIWWIPGGSQTQPAASSLYGSERVWSTAHVVYNAKTNPTGSANDVPDSAGNHNGTSAGTMGALTAGPGDIGNEWDFDAINDEITFGNWTPNEDITIEFWSNIPNTTTQYAIVGKHDASGGNQFVLLFSSAGSLASIVHASLQNTGTSATGDNHWYVTVDASNGNVDWYKNGSLVISQSHGSTLTLGDIADGKEWVWGQEWDGVSKSDWYGDTLAAMRIYRQVDSSAANVVLTKYNNQNDQSTFWSAGLIVGGAAGGPPKGLTANKGLKMRM